MEYCTDCGAELSAGDSYCSDCGSPVDSPAATDEEQTSLIRASLSVGFAVFLVITTLLFVVSLVSETSRGFLSVTIITWAVPGAIAATLGAIPFIYLMR